MLCYATVTAVIIRTLQARVSKNANLAMFTRLILLKVLTVMEDTVVHLRSWVQG